jgi:hypothetical protein
LTIRRDLPRKTGSIAPHGDQRIRDGCTGLIDHCAGQARGAILRRRGMNESRDKRGSEEHDLQKFGHWFNWVKY